MIINKKIVAVSVAVVVLSVFHYFTENVFSWDGSIPAGYANDPASNNRNCTNCHGGTATNVSGWITSNVPASGYTPGATYAITLTVTGTGGKKGFSISPQNPSGEFLGTLIAGAGTSINGSNHYISNSGTNITTDPMTWTFNWIAPSSGHGIVKFYSAVSIGKNITKVTSYTINENPSDIFETSNENIFSFYPNPVTEKLYINYLTNKNSYIEINLYSIIGKKIANLFKHMKPVGKYQEQINLNNYVSEGTYIIEFKIANKSTFQKIIVK